MVFGGDSCFFLLSVFVEVGLNGYNPILVVDRESLHPRVVGSDDVDVAVAKRDAYHDGWDEDVAGAWHAVAFGESEVFEPLESFDSDGVEAGNAYGGVVSGDFGGFGSIAAWNVESHGPIDFVGEAVAE